MHTTDNIRFFFFFFFCLCSRAFSSAVGTTRPPTLWIPDSSAAFNLPWSELIVHLFTVSTVCLQTGKRCLFFVLRSARGHLQLFTVCLTMLSNCRMICGWEVGEVGSGGGAVESSYCLYICQLLRISPQ
jgi:hypothetical protein